MSSMRLMVWARFSSSFTLTFLSSFHEKLSSSSRSIWSPFLVSRFILLVGSKRSWNAVLPTKVLQLLVALHLDHRDLVLIVLLEPGDLFLLDRLRPLVLVDTASREHLDVDHGALDAGGHGQRGVAHVPGLLAEDRAEQLLFRRQLRLTLRRDLADQDVT